MTEKVLSFLIFYVVMVTFGGVSQAATYLAEKRKSFHLDSERNNLIVIVCHSRFFDTMSPRWSWFWKVLYL